MTADTMPAGPLEMVHSCRVLDHASGRHVARIANCSHAFAGELIRRYNAHAELFAALDALVDGCTPEQMPSEIASGRIAGVQMPERANVDAARAVRDKWGKT